MILPVIILSRHIALQRVAVVEVKVDLIVFGPVL
jgi:hypothetical protein